MLHDRSDASDHNDMTVILRFYSNLRSEKLSYVDVIRLVLRIVVTNPLMGHGLMNESGM